MIKESFRCWWYQWLELQKKHLPWDRKTPGLLLLLSGIGIAFMYSIQRGYDNGKWKMQILWLCLGFLVYFGTASIHYHFFFRKSHLLYILSIVLLLLLWTPMGRTLGGSRRWLSLGMITFQPSNVSEVATLLILASTLMRTRWITIRDAYPTLGFTFFVSGLSFFLIFLQPDLGSALVIPILCFGLLFVSQLPLRFFCILFFVCSVVFGLIAADTRGYYCQIKQQPSFWKPFLPLKNYQRNRILSFAVPTSIDPKGVHVGWHLKQSLIAIGSGGWFGKGWTHNTQARLGFLPQAASLDDFIFSVLAEEAGLVGALFVLVLYILLVFNNFRIALMARDRLGCYFCVGVGLFMMSHIWINIGMTLGIMPITGLPTPFLSYGGSFLLMCFFCQGLVQSVYRFRWYEE
ncbi:MAG: rod shape-determining protein RodA [Opitutales bacterium]|nr:rod shape-determining protein RodA [Opitutales bacterium]